MHDVRKIEILTLIAQIFADKERIKADAKRNAHAHRATEDFGSALSASIRHFCAICVKELGFSG
jgi:hypothetical protein